MIEFISAKKFKSFDKLAFFLAISSILVLQYATALDGQYIKKNSNFFITRQTPDRKNLLAWDFSIINATGDSRTLTARLDTISVSNGSFVFGNTTKFDLMVDHLDFQFQIMECSQNLDDPALTRAVIIVPIVQPIYVQPSVPTAPPPLSLTRGHVSIFPAGQPTIPAARLPLTKTCAYRQPDEWGRDIVGRNINQDYATQLLTPDLSGIDISYGKIAKFVPIQESTFTSSSTSTSFIKNYDLKTTMRLICGYEYNTSIQISITSERVLDVTFIFISPAGCPQVVDTFDPFWTLLDIFLISIGVVIIGTGGVIFLVIGVCFTTAFCGIVFLSFFAVMTGNNVPAPAPSPIFVSFAAINPFLWFLFQDPPTTNPRTRTRTRPRPRPSVVVPATNPSQGPAAEEEESQPPVVINDTTNEIHTITIDGTVRRFVEVEHDEVHVAAAENEAVVQLSPETSPKQSLR